MASLEDLTADQLLARAKEMESSHSLLQTLSKNPKTREMLQRAIKTANPEIPIPEIDKEDKVMAAIGERDKKLESLENQIRERDIRDRLERQRAKAMADHQLTEADLLEVEKLMTTEKVEERFPSYETAAKYFKASRTPSTPTPSSFLPPTFSMPEKEVWAKGIGNPSLLNKIAMDQAFQVMNDLRSGKTTGN